MQAGMPYHLTIRCTETTTNSKTSREVVYMLKEVARYGSFNKRDTPKETEELVNKPEMVRCPIKEVYNPWLISKDDFNPFAIYGG